MSEDKSVESAPEGSAPVTQIDSGRQPEPVLGYDFVVPSVPARLHCALLCHEVTKALNDAHNEHTIPWELNKDSVLAGVEFHIENPDATPEDSHNKWMEYKLQNGWKWGPNKSAELKTHPLLKPFAELGSTQQAKDMMFRAIVHSYFGLKS